MDWNTWRDKLHQTAVDHGFYDKAVPFEQTIALIHSEFSEALEEMRAGKPNVYAMIPIKGFTGNMNCGCVDDRNLWTKHDKPEGAAIEITDAIIRILDYCGYSGTEAKPVKMALPSDVSEMYLLTEAHAQLSYAWKWRADEIARTACIQRALGLCVILIERMGDDVETLIMLKDNYNQTRAHKHGKVF